MYAAIAGLKTHMTKMSVIGNNIANVNTAGYKSQRTVFKDAMYTMYSSGSDGTSTTAGRNPSQIGYGSQVSSIDLNMSTGSFAPGTSTDCMIYGDGFFMVGDKDTANVIDPMNPSSVKSLNLTRVGDFSFKADGYLSDGSGGVVYGFLATGVDQNGKPIISDQLVPIRLPKMSAVPVLNDNDEPTGEYTYKVQYPTAGTAEQPAVLQDYVEYTVPGDTTSAQIDVPFAQLDSVSIDSETGAITGTTKDTDELITIGYVAIGNVTNPNGLTHAGGFYYTAGSGAGDLQVSLLGGVADDLKIKHVNGSLYEKAKADYAAALGDAAGDMTNMTQSDKMAIGSAGGTNLMTGGLEGSNVDLANEIAEMITTQRGYQANTRIITVTDAMLEELVNMKR
ncbi:MAG: flagellar hook-basal body complex protein [Oscillospiraceae bacterium]|nr:flagellar hook-basal body complex protein [Oscillospiraceae bacterium]